MNARCDRTTATLISSWQTTSRSTDDDDATPPSPAFHPAVEAFKRRLLADTIGSCGGNKAEAARRLGLQRTYLYRLVRQLGLERSSTENPSQA
jgi:DNA-binding NtrC family response regulator